MSIELQYLVWTVALGVVQLVLAATFSTAQRGPKWNAGARDAPAVPLHGVAGRLERAFRNLMETFPFFAALVLVVAVAGRSDAHTVLGAQLYFWSRLLYVPIYAAGIPYVRTLVWAVGCAGLLMLLWGACA